MQFWLLSLAIRLGYLEAPTWWYLPYSAVWLQFSQQQFRHAAESLCSLTPQCPLHMQEQAAAVTGLEMVLPCLKAVVPLDQAFHKVQVPGFM